jgi:hypothetical protein
MFRKLRKSRIALAAPALLVFAAVGYIFERDYIVSVRASHITVAQRPTYPQPDELAGAPRVFRASGVQGSVDRGSRLRMGGWQHRRGMGN